MICPAWGLENLLKAVPDALFARKLNVNVLFIGPMVSVTTGSLPTD